VAQRAPESTTGKPMKAPYINLHRSYQAIHLLPYLLQEYVRDGKRPKRNDTRAMFDHVVVQVLGRAMASEPKPGSKTKRNPLTITDTCYPSLMTICRHTALSESSVRRALDRLIANGYAHLAPGHLRTALNLLDQSHDMRVALSVLDHEAA
jgi:hypothetical protein